MDKTCCICGTVRNCEPFLDKVISKISKIDAIKLVYSIAKENIKSKNNLIF